MRSAFDLAVASIAGFALAAPLALPGLQLANDSIHTESVVSPVLSGRSLLRTILLSGASTGYVGVIALTLASLAVAVRRNQPEVLGLGAMTLVMAMLSYAPPAVWLAQRLPGGGTAQGNGRAADGLRIGGPGWNRCRCAHTVPQ